LFGGGLRENEKVAGASQFLDTSAWLSWKNRSKRVTRLYRRFKNAKIALFCFRETKSFSEFV
jgi:hypothetical protein